MRTNTRNSPSKSFYCLPNPLNPSCILLPNKNQHHQTWPLCPLTDVYYNHVALSRFNQTVTVHLLCGLDTHYNHVCHAITEQTPAQGITRPDICAPWLTFIAITLLSFLPQFNHCIYFEVWTHITLMFASNNHEAYKWLNTNWPVPPLEVIVYCNHVVPLSVGI